MFDQYSLTLPHLNLAQGLSVIFFKHRLPNICLLANDEFVLTDLVCF